MTRKEMRKLRAQRAANMAALYKAGQTLQQIGEAFGVSRERVRQLIRGECGLRGPDGGQRVAMDRKRQARATKRNADLFRKYGCGEAEMAEAFAVAEQMIAAGIGIYRTPTYAFQRQRTSAKERGIEWRLTFWEWWCIWKASGKWAMRGRGTGYVMCRVGDVGPYAVGNVFIATAVENSSNQARKKNGLPTGVQRHGQRYHAVRCVKGKGVTLGIYDTVAEAHARYLIGTPDPNYHPARVHGFQIPEVQERARAARLARAPEGRAA